MFGDFEMILKQTSSDHFPVDLFANGAKHFQTFANIQNWQKLQIFNNFISLKYLYRFQKKYFRRAKRAEKNFLDDAW